MRISYSPYILIILLVMVSCKKEEDPSPDQRYLDIMSGEWRIESIQFEVDGEDSLILQPEGSFVFDHCMISDQVSGTCQGIYLVEDYEVSSFQFDVNSTSNSVIFTPHPTEETADPLGLHTGYFEFFRLSSNEIILEGNTSIDGEFRNRQTTIVLRKVR